MHKAYIVGKEQVVLHEEPLPQLTDQTILIRVLGCGICGSDKAWYRTSQEPCKIPIGHEVLGEIIAIGAKVDHKWNSVKYVALSSSRPCEKCLNCQRGLQQYCLEPSECKIEGFAEYVCLEPEFVLPIDSEDMDDTFHLIEPLSVAFSLVEESRLRAGQKILVSGSGTIGLLAAWVLQDINMDVTITVRNPQSRAAKWLTSQGIQSILWEESIQNLGAYDTLISTTPYCTLKHLIPLVRNGGVLVFNGFDGNVNYLHPVNLSLVHRKQIRLTGVYSRPQIYLQKAVETVIRKKAELAELVTDRFSLEAIQRAFQAAVAPSSDRDSIKVIVMMK